jgi:hypothetical protein
VNFMCETMTLPPATETVMLPVTFDVRATASVSVGWLMNFSFAR